jgi:hypothetical protein
MTYSVEQLYSLLKLKMSKKQTRLPAHVIYEKQENILAIYDAETEVVVNQIQATYPFNFAHRLRDGRILAACEGNEYGLQFFDAATHAVTHKPFSEYIYTTLELSNGDILCEISRQGISLWKDTKQSILDTFFMISKAFVSSMLRLSNGDILISTHEIKLFTENLEHKKDITIDTTLGDISYIKLIEIEPGIVLGLNQGLFIHKIDIYKGIVTMWTQIEDEPSCGILLESGNIVIVLSDGNMCVFDKYGNTLHKMDSYGKIYTEAIGQVCPGSFVVLIDRQLTYICERTGNTLKRVPLEAERLHSFY